MVARIPSIVVISVVMVARIPSVVVVSVARISSVVVVSVVRICVARIYVALGFCRCSLIDGRFKVEVWTKSRRHSCRRGWRERRARSWRVEVARCCKVRGVTSLQELSDSLVHFFDAAFLNAFARAAFPHYVAHVSIGLFGGQLYLSHTLGEVLELAFPSFYDKVVGRYRGGRGGIL